ncbi:PREDICTED: uncharacterized protein LOC109115946 [Nelumbo nucifera]|uniref:Uncharacterized protein LOC109115946 n=1 Tax=Nelumbo nucifera TaxID=4432 RepID=A0A1U8QCX7_NELNU|nr:PREDICTED: uncharacterized protein LOC109115946 [Nelumbo nucifera]
MELPPGVNIPGSEVYVDDIVIARDDISRIAELKSFLATKFEIKDLGNLRYFLGVEVARSKRGIYISQRKYALDLLHELGVDDGDVLLDKGVYQRLVGRLLNLCLTRPDISYFVSVVSQYMHKPRSSHMQAVKRILAYLKGCPRKGILYSNHGHLKVEAYSNADWAGSIDDRRSTSGYCTLVGGNIVSWRSKKQSVVA